MKEYQYLIKCKTCGREYPISMKRSIERKRKGIKGLLKLLPCGHREFEEITRIFYKEKEETKQTSLTEF